MDGRDGTQGYSLLGTLCLTEGVSEAEPNDTVESASPAAFGEDIEGALCETDVDYFVFEGGVAGETISVTSSKGFPRFTLRTAEGNLIARSGTAESITTQLRTDGRFFLIVERYLLFDREYTIRVDREAAAQ